MLIYIKFLLLILKNWCLIFFVKEKYLLHCEKLQLYLRQGLEFSKKVSCIRIQSVTMAIQKRMEAEKNSDKMEKCCKN